MNPLRHLLYLLLLWGRPLVLGITGLVVPATGLGGLAYGFITGWTSTPCLVLLATSFLTLVVAFLYDTFLLWVAPEDVGLFF